MQIHYDEWEWTLWKCPGFTFALDFYDGKYRGNMKFAMMQSIFVPIIYQIIKKVLKADLESIFLHMNVI